MFTPQTLSEQEIDEIADLLLSEELGFGCETKAEALEYIQSYPIVKFSNYITDGPGYSGDIFVLVGGVLHAITIYRNPGRKTHFLQRLAIQ